MLGRADGRMRKVQWYRGPSAIALLLIGAPCTKTRTVVVEESVATTLATRVLGRDGSSVQLAGAPKVGGVPPVRLRALVLKVMSLPVPATIKPPVVRLEVITTSVPATPKAESRPMKTVSGVAVTVGVGV